VPTYGIKYDANGGTGLYDALGGYSDTYPVAGQSAKSPNPGYRIPTTTFGNTSIVKMNARTNEFKGWNTKADGTGTMFQPGDVIPDSAFFQLADNGNITLYAKWAILCECKLCPLCGGCLELVCPCLGEDCACAPCEHMVYDKAVELVTLKMVEKILADVKATTTDPAAIAAGVIKEIAAILAANNLNADASHVLSARNILAYVSTAKETYRGDPINYTVSLAGVKDIGAVSFDFTIDTANQLFDPGTAVTALNGFSILTQKWTDLGGGLQKCSVTLVYPGFITAASPLDILAVKTSALNKTGEAAMTISNMEITGNAGGMSGYRHNTIIGATATTNISDYPPVYSKYDLNHDGKIDMLDTNIAVYFYLKTSSSPGWDTDKFDIATAKDADVNGSGRVDLADLIEIVAHYMSSYNLYPN